MAKVNDFNSSNKTFRAILGNGVLYNVPSFQRNYSWKQEHWEELWHDLKVVIKSDYQEPHYLGYLVLQNESRATTFKIIDGQQRLVTLSLLVLAVSKRFKSESDDPRSEKIRETYLIASEDIKTLKKRNKLKLNRNNEMFYNDLLKDELKEKPKGSNLLLSQALAYFEKCLDEANFTKDSLADFIDLLPDCLFFTEIQVNNETNAYKVFETLNARGVQLSSADLLKNYLFSKAAEYEKEGENELQEMEHQWENFVTNLGDDKKATDVIRYYWNATHEKFARKKELYKAIHEGMNSPEDVFDLIEGLVRIATFWRSVHEKQSPSTGFDLEDLQEFEDLSTTQEYPVLFSAHLSGLAKDDCTALLKLLNKLNFRYSVAGKNPNDKEKVYAKLAFKLFTKEIRTQEEIKAFLMSSKLYVDKQMFIEAFKTFEFKPANAKDTRKAKRLLAKIERLPLNVLDPKLSLEHISPTSAKLEGSNWLGNLTLLDAKANKKKDNDFHASKKVYAKSKYGITKDLASEPEWTTDSIEKRTAKFAKIIEDLYRIS
jgi:uncharacterized protein with ParB-like and HNH nuclease domain